MQSPAPDHLSAILLESPQHQESEMARLQAALKQQTVSVQLLDSRAELTLSQAPGVCYLPFAADLVPSLLEDLQHSLEQTGADLLLLSPQEGFPKNHHLGQEQTLEKFCQNFPLPPLFTTPKLLEKLLEQTSAAQSFPQLLKKQNLRGLVLHRPWLRSLGHSSLLEEPSSEEPKPNQPQELSLHSHLSLQPKFTSYAPLTDCQPAAWQKPRPRATRPEKRPHLIQLLPYLEMGGADKFALDLCEALPRYTHWEVSLLTTEQHANAWLEKARESTPDVHELPAFLPPSSLPAAIARHARSRAADALLLTHSFFGYRLLPWLAQTLPDLTLADYLHIEHPDWKSGGHPRLSILHQDYLDLSFTSSAHLARWCQDHGRDPRGQQVVHTNIDTQVWNPSAFDAQQIRAELEIPPEHCLILVAMRMVYQKQPELLLDILTQLEAENPPFTCLVCGDGEQLELIQKLHAERGLKQSRLLGAKPNAEIKRLMAAADLFLLPTRMEGIALSLFEAMAMQCVPVAAAVGGQAELVTAEVGSLIERSQGREAEQNFYLEALRELIQNPPAREQKKRAARERIKAQFSLRHMAEKLGAALDQAPQQRAPRPSLSPRQAETLAIEAIEASQLQEQLESGELALRKRFLERITQRDGQIERLKAKLEKNQAELAQLHAKREAKPWRKIERKLRGKK